MVAPVVAKVVREPTNKTSQWQKKKKETREVEESPEKAAAHTGL
jgi:hypothetical protein